LGNWSAFYPLDVPHRTGGGIVSFLGRMGECFPKLLIKLQIPVLGLRR
jgi:hypothetical protein